MSDDTDNVTPIPQSGGNNSGGGKSPEQIGNDIRTNMLKSVGDAYKSKRKAAMDEIIAANKALSLAKANLVKMDREYQMEIDSLKSMEF